MYHNWQIEPYGQTALLDKGLTLLRLEILTPIVVQPYLANGTKLHSRRWRGKIVLHAVQLLTPTGIVVHRRRMQAHHRIAITRLGPCKVEHTLVALGVDGWQQQLTDTRGPCSRKCLLSVAIELLGIYM